MTLSTTGQHNVSALSFVLPLLGCFFQAVQGSPLTNYILRDQHYTAQEIRIFECLRLILDSRSAIVHTMLLSSADKCYCMMDHALLLRATPRTNFTKSQNVSIRIILSYCQFQKQSFANCFSLQLPDSMTSSLNSISKCHEHISLHITDNPLSSNTTPPPPALQNMPHHHNSHTQCSKPRF